MDKEDFITKASESEQFSLIHEFIFRFKEANDLNHFCITDKQIGKILEIMRNDRN